MNYAHGEADVKRIEAKIQQIFISGGREAEISLSLLRLLAAIALEDFSVFHDELHILQRFHVAQWVAVDCNDVRKCAWSDHSELSLHVEHGGGARGCALNGVHRRQIGRA